MEDPIRFDVYGKASPAAVKETAEALLAYGVYASELEARKAATRSRQEGVHVLIARSLTWGAAQLLASAQLPFVELAIFQEGYSPADRTHFCAEHKLFHGGCLGCHVCAGFYVR